MAKDISFYMRFVLIIMYLEMSIHEVVSDHGFGLITRLIMKRNKVNHNVNGPNIHQNKCPTIPRGYECFVCGSTFETNQERLVHLERFRHIDLYNTGSPQEREEVHRLSL